MNADQLKKSILKYALEGLLSVQDLEKEHSKNTMDAIYEKRLQLTQEKKIKPQKSLPSINDNEVPYDIPANWTWVRLNDLAENCPVPFADGPFGSNLKKEHYTLSPEVRIIQLSNIGEHGWKNNNVKYTTYEHLETIKRSQVKTGDIVIAKMMPAGRAILVPNINETYVLSSDAVKFVPHKLLNKSFLLYALNSSVFKDQIYSEVQGITRVRTSLTKIKKYLLPIPPVEEQKRIVEKIEELFFKIDSYATYYLELDSLNKRFPKDLEKSILQYAIQGKLVEQDTADEPASELLKRISEQKEQMVKEKVIKKEKPLPPITEEEIPFDIPEMWQWVRLKNISTFGNFNQASPQKINPDDWVLDLEEIEKNTGRILEQKTASEKTIKSNKYKFNQNDVLYGKLRPYLNKVTIAPHEGYCTTEIFPITLIKGVYPKYIQYVLMSPYFLNYAHSLSYGVKMPRLGTTQIANALIPLPPANEQIKIVEKIEEMIKPVRNLSLLNER